MRPTSWPLSCGRTTARSASSSSSTSCSRRVLHKVDVVTGEGTVGTVIQVTFPPGNPGPQSYKEEFVKIDHENRVKEAAVTEGDILTIGFTKYVTRFEIIEKGPTSSVIRSTVEYEFDDGRSELEAAASTAPMAAAAEAIVKHVKEELAAPAPAAASS